MLIIFLSLRCMPTSRRWCILEYRNMLNISKQVFAAGMRTSRCPDSGFANEDFLYYGPVTPVAIYIPGLILWTPWGPRPAERGFQEYLQQNVESYSVPAPLLRTGHGRLTYRGTNITPHNMIYCAHLQPT